MKNSEDKTKAQPLRESGEVREQEKIREAVFSATPEIIVVMDKDWNIHDVNEAMAGRFCKHRQALADVGSAEGERGEVFQSIPCCCQQTIQHQSNGKDYKTNVNEKVKY